jgi:hypothetical protein
MVTLAGPELRASQSTSPFIECQVDPANHHREFVPKLPCPGSPNPLLDPAFNLRPDLFRRLPQTQYGHRACGSPSREADQRIEFVTNILPSKSGVNGLRLPFSWDFNTARFAGRFGKTTATKKFKAPAQSGTAHTAMAE